MFKYFLSLILSIGLLMGSTSCNSCNKPKAGGTPIGMDTTSKTNIDNEVGLESPENEGYKDTVIEVSDVASLLRNLGSNRTLKLAKGKYIIPNVVPAGLKNINLTFSQDGIRIRGLSNLFITTNDTGVTLEQPLSTNKVFIFEGCENIQLAGFTAGHTPKPGGCAASVLQFIDAKGVWVRDCDLFGCGYEGITILKSDNIRVDRTIIRECSAQMLSAIDASNLRFIGCTFTRNNRKPGSGKVFLANSDAILFMGCTFSDNLSAPTETLFTVTNAEGVRLKECTFRNNKGRGLIVDSTKLILIDIQAEGNSWQAPI